MGNLRYDAQNLRNALARIRHDAGALYVFGVNGEHEVADADREAFRDIANMAGAALSGDPFEQPAYDVELERRRGVRGAPQAAP